MTASKSYHHGNLKQALVDAGLAILEAEGLGALSLRACAERVGVSHTAPKNHFGNVTGLLTAIAGEGFLRLNDMIRAAPDATLPDRRRTALTGYVAFARQNPALFELMFSPGKVEFHDPAIAAPLAICAEVLRDVSGAGGGPAGAGFGVEEIRVWSLVHGFATLGAQGVFDKEAMREIGILDLLPELREGADG
ncbi:TetR/AcrR family transcriptional regulator [Oceanicola sp. 22II-s10i]|uniref:TetR/AcrR family transcriptional regulator n=1 Tax=Oceanicola sp. 22II-s10i TaxID=1317116 RepID=UPI001595F0A3|nr:TetR/AcrR family transcriptional regulator [Oceanicola sp. 22II-s10i]